MSHNCTVLIPRGDICCWDIVQWDYYGVGVDGINHQNSFLWVGCPKCGPETPLAVTDRGKFSGKFKFQCTKQISCGYEDWLPYGQGIDIGILLDTRTDEDIKKWLHYWVSEEVEVTVSNEQRM